MRHILTFYMNIYKENNICIDNINALDEFLKSEEFDTETFEYQINIWNNNNAFNTNNECIQQIKKNIYNQQKVCHIVYRKFLIRLFFILNF